MKAQNIVRTVTLGEICNFLRGQTITSKNAVDGSVPVVAGGLQPSYYHNISNRGANTIAVAGSGAYAGYVSYWDKPIYLSDAFSVETSNNVVKKYVYYFLKLNQEKIYSFQKGAGIPHVHGSDIKNLLINIPDVTIQEEIVKILDSFTNLIDALNEELSLRQKQFEYYREKLLTFDDNVNWDLFDNIGEITDYVANGSFADLKKNVKYLQESNYAILVRTLDLSSNFKNNNFVYIDKNAYDFLEKSKLFGGEIIINNVGAGVGTVFCCPKLERKMSLGPNSVVLKTDNNKFYYYWLSSKQGQDKIFQITSFSALPKFNKTSFKQILFPVIDEKIDADYIVEKLDAFESLIASLKEEIALRQKQYEYYREKLLTFD